MDKKLVLTWAGAARPKTLAAAFVPVLVGSSLAYSDGVFFLPASLTALFCALLIQIGTNFANDYYDFKKGADTEQRIGFTRATSTGLIEPRQMLLATYITMTMAFLTGLYLVWLAGWVILVIGLLSLLFGILYTGGPFPLGYNGLGDVFVFIFFGFAAVMGTYYVNALSWSADSFIASVPVGALSVNILVANNLRDIEQDKIVNKKTLGVLFGESVLKWEYTLMILLSYFILLYLNMFQNYNLYIYIPLLTLPLIVILLKEIWFHRDKSTLNKTLEKTARFMVVYGILFSAGILLQS
ncbi:MAG TPA: 1,4-dihydroxy-2-naphthoate polyprenyltransferase [Balneolaceae bacterium]|nr:1,4-dihydroxy-2-naphthoate polyprenyltransferase [Balneolaceae bacterium]